MRVVYAAQAPESQKRYAAVGLGNFDGLHIGHMTLINTLISEARLSGLESIVYTFRKHPENIIRKRLITPLLTTEGKRISVLSETLLDTLFFDEFTEEFSRTEPEDFVKKVLVDRLRCKLVVCGFDYRFGYRGHGDVELMQRLGRKYGFRVVVIPPISVENEVVSSTRIRNLVQKGQMDRVFDLLGRHFSVTGEVRTGRQIGNTIGFPTANLIPEDYLILPSDGIYITRTMIDGMFVPGVTNVGTNPTFGALENRVVETHLLDFSQDIYNRHIEVFFLKRVRAEKKFSSKEELIAKIEQDVRVARTYFAQEGFHA